MSVIHYALKDTTQMMVISVALQTIDTDQCQTCAIGFVVEHAQSPAAPTGHAERKGSSRGVVSGAAGGIKAGLAAARPGR